MVDESERDRQGVKEKADHQKERKKELQHVEVVKKDKVGRSYEKSVMVGWPVGDRV